MTSVPPVNSTIQYPRQTVIRAERAMRCSPFRLQLFIEMVRDSVSLQAIAQTAGIQHDYTDRPLSDLTAEDELLWLIQVGLLRREVDGQGLTDCFRVTPLGRQLVQTWQARGDACFAPPSWGDRLLNTFNRWFGWLGISI